jgi:hypothetical protein
MQHGVVAGRVQALLDDIGDRRLAGAGEAGEPEDRWPLLLEGRALFLADQQRLPVDVGAAAQPEGDHPGADGMVAEALDDDERAGLPIHRVGVERHGRRGGKVAEGDVVQGEGARGQVRAGVHVDLVFERRDRHRQCPGADASEVAAPGHHRLLAHPDDMGGELIGHLRARRGRHQHVAPGNVDIVDKGQRHRVAGCGGCERTVIGDDFLEAGDPPRAGDGDRIARRDPAGSDRAGIAAKILIRAIDPLHGKTEWRVRVYAAELHGLQRLEQRGPLVPGHIGRRPGDVVAEARRDRDRHDRGETELAGESTIVARDALEGVARVVHQVDLVHGDDDAANAEQRADQGMAPGLHQHPFAGIDQDDCELRRGGAGRHVAGVMLVSRRVGDDKRPLVGGEEAVSDVDGDALLALRLETVDQQREIDVRAGGAVLGRILDQARELIVENELGIVQQPPDQSRLAVIYRPTGDKAQQVLGGSALIERGGENAVHQK